jgi:hypothetical protein
VESIPILLIRLDTLLQAFDRLVLGRRSAEVIHGPIGVIAILPLQGQDLVLEPGVLGAQRLGQTLGFLEAGPGNDRAARAESREEDG